MEENKKTAPEVPIGNQSDEIRLFIDGKCINEVINNALDIHTKLVRDKKITFIIKELEGLSFREWQAIEQCVNNEYRRIANKNTLTDSESIIKNILLDLIS